MPRHQETSLNKNSAVYCRTACNCYHACVSVTGSYSGSDSCNYCNRICRVKSSKVKGSQVDQVNEFPPNSWSHTSNTSGKHWQVPAPWSHVQSLRTAKHRTGGVPRMKSGKLWKLVAELAPKPETRNEVRSGHCFPKRLLEFWPCCVETATSLALTRSMTSASYAAQVKWQPCSLLWKLALLVASGCHQQAVPSGGCQRALSITGRSCDLTPLLEHTGWGKLKERSLEFKRKST